MIRKAVLALIVLLTFTLTDCQRDSSPTSPSASAPFPPGGSNICSVQPAISGSCGTGTAVCNDGSYSCSQNRQGTCSSHGGVRCWICPGPLCNGLTSSMANPPLRQ